MMLKVRLIVFLIVTVFVASSAVCLAADPTVVTLSHFDGNINRQLETLFGSIENLEAFEEANNIKVQYVVRSGERLPKAIASYVAGEAEDIVIWDGSDQGAGLAAEGYFYNLDAWYEVSGMNQKITPAGLSIAANGTPGGTKYWIPYNVNAEAGIMFINKDMFDEIGLDYPTSETTLEEVFDMCYAISKGDGENRVYGMMVPSWFNPAWYGFTLGMKLYDAETMTATVDTAEWISYLKQWEQIFSIDRVAVVAASYTADFVQRRAALNMTTTKVSYLSTTMEFDWDVAVAPAHEAADGMRFTPQGNVMSITPSDHVEATLRVAEYIVRAVSENGTAMSYYISDGAADALRARGHLDAEKKGVPIIYPDAPEHLGDFLSAVYPVVDRSQLVGAVEAQQWDLMAPFREILVGTLSTEQAVSQVQQAIQAVLDEEKSRQ